MTMEATIDMQNAILLTTFPQHLKIYNIGGYTFTDYNNNVHTFYGLLYYLLSFKATS